MKTLSRNEMKKVMGGLVQFCCLHSADWTQLDCANTTLSDIKTVFYDDGANQQYSNYCCSSCASSYQSATGTIFPGSNS